MVFQLNQIAGKSKITANARRRLGQRECLPGIGFVGGFTLSTMEISSIEPAAAMEIQNESLSVSDLAWAV